MRVKFITTYPPTNCGIAVYSGHYVEALKKLCDVSVISIQRPKLNPLYFIKLALASRKDADVAHVQFDCGFFGMLSIGPLSISGMYIPLYYSLTRVPGGPKIVTTVHELVDVKKTYGGRLLYWPMRLYYTTLYRSMASFSDTVIVHTDESVKTFSQYSKTDKTRVVPHACFIDPLFLPAEDCKKKLGLSGKRVVTMFGFVSPFKGHDLAIEAIKSLPDDVVLYIAGDGRTPEDKEYARHLRQKVRSMGLESRVIFHGYVSDEDTPAVLCAADIVLMPYLHVVQSGALYYALAYLKPVLASDMGGFAEVAREYGCIETFRPCDIKDMVAKLQYMLSGQEQLERQRQKSKKYISSVSMDSIALRTYEIYRKIIDS